MEELNPKSPQEWEQEEAEKRFLEGGRAKPPSPREKLNQH
jgi:hypothetical protein